jgi:hypothetical protein
VPYIKKADRRRIDNGAEPVTAGEAAYWLTLQGLERLARHTERTFAARAAAVGHMQTLPWPTSVFGDTAIAWSGARDLAIDEFKRRIDMDGYEDKKRKENGDLPGFGGKGGAT